MSLAASPDGRWGMGKEGGGHPVTACPAPPRRPPPPSGTGTGGSRDPASTRTSFLLTPVVPVSGARGGVGAGALGSGGGVPRGVTGRVRATPPLAASAPFPLLHTLCSPGAPSMGGFRPPQVPPPGEIALFCSHKPLFYPNLGLWGPQGGSQLPSALAGWHWGVPLQQCWALGGNRPPLFSAEKLGFKPGRAVPVLRGACTQPCASLCSQSSLGGENRSQKECPPV